MTRAALLCKKRKEPALALLLLAMPAHAGEITRQAASDFVMLGMASAFVASIASILLAGFGNRLWGALLFVALMVAALAIALLPLPASAGDSAPGAALWPQEPRYEATVIEASTIGPLWGCMDAGACCGVHVDCGGWQDALAPVPLPGAGLMLAAALGLLWRMKHG